MATSSEPRAVEAPAPATVPPVSDAHPVLITPPSEVMRMLAEAYRLRERA